MAKYLITGGAGFIGSNLVSRLVEDGESVTVYDNFATGKRSNLGDVTDRVTLVEADVRDRDQLATTTLGMDYVIHLAALPSVPRSVSDPVSTHDVCASGTLNALLAARDAKVKRFVYASSSALYGDTKKLPKTESFNSAPVSPYGTAKLTGESYCSVFHRVYGLPTVSLRYFNVYGPRQDPASQYAAAVASFVTRFLKGESPVVYGDGEQTRDFTFIDDVVQANILACRTQGLGGEVCNIAGGRRIRLNELLRILREIIDPTCEVQYLDSRPGDIRDSEADISQAQKILGFEPRVPVEDGLRRTTEWYRSQM